MKKNKIRKSHLWDEMVDARCPYCGCFCHYCAPAAEDTELMCSFCKKEFVLGRLK